MRVVSWNIRAAIGPGPFPDRWWRRIDAERLRAIGVFLSGLDADLVALQEVALLSRDGDLVDNAGDLARGLGMDVRYAAVRSFEAIEGGMRLGAGVFGNALLSRRPMAAARCLPLPQAAVDTLVEPVGTLHPLTGQPHPAAGVRYADAPPTIREPRCLLVAEVGALTVGCTHFSHIGSAERRLQAEATLAAFDGAAAALLLGDLNAAIEAPELEPFGSWADAFAEPPGDAARVSTDEGWRIDQVLGRGARVSGARVLREAGPLSDHYPVVAEVDLA